MQQATPTPLDHLDLQIVADGRHSVPTRLGIEADGKRVATIDLPAVPDGATLGDTVSVPVDLPEPVVATDAPGHHRRGARGAHAPVEPPRAPTMPVGIAELGWGDPTATPATGVFTSGCRRDLLTVDGDPVGIVVRGTMAAAATGGALAITTCSGRPSTSPPAST